MTDILTLGTAPQGYVRIHARLKKDEALRWAQRSRDEDGRAVCIVKVSSHTDLWHVYAKARR